MKKTIRFCLILAAITFCRIFARAEVCKGICLDESGNGKVYNGDDYYNYISYERTTANAGDEVLTIDILNPLNNYCDDIVLRIDYNTTTKRINWN